jgi:transcriptional regulator with XRE-family HTH domain
VRKNPERAFYRAMGHRIAQARSRKRLTQREFAVLAGIPRSTIGNIECGHQTVSVHLIHAIARTLGTTVSHLTGETEDAR